MVIRCLFSSLARAVLHPVVDVAPGARGGVAQSGSAAPPPAVDAGALGFARGAARGTQVLGAVGPGRAGLRHGAAHARRAAGRPAARRPRRARRRPGRPARRPGRPGAAAGAAATVVFGPFWTLRSRSSNSSPSASRTRSGVTSATFMPLIVSPTRTLRDLPVPPGLAQVGDRDLVGDQRAGEHELAALDHRLRRLGERGRAPGAAWR